MRQLSRLKWAVFEKIHGASFCFVLEPATIRCASRRSLLASDDTFFAYRRVLKSLTGPLEMLRADLAEAWPDADRFLVYGELFGGQYPHPDVPAVSGVQAIQTGVWYCPDVAFFAFDLARVVDGERLEAAGCRSVRPSRWVRWVMPCPRQWSSPPPCPPCSDCLRWSTTSPPGRGESVG